MTSLDNEPSGKGKVLTGKDYLQDLKLHIDIMGQLQEDDQAKIPRRKKIYRIAENIIEVLNELEIAAENKPNGADANKLKAMYYSYGVDSVEDLGMLLAQQQDAALQKAEFKGLVMGDNAIVDFDNMKKFTGIGGKGFSARAREASQKSGYSGSS